MRTVSILFACAVTILASCSTSDEPDGTDKRILGGPIVVSNAHATILNTHNNGTILSDGFEILEVEGTQPAVLEGVSPIGGDSTLHFLGGRVGMPGRPDDFNQIMQGFPPKAVPERYQRDLVGTVIEPGETYMLILGYEVIDATQTGRREGIELLYSVGERRFEVSLPAGLVTCPDGVDEKQCEDMAGI